MESDPTRTMIAPGQAATVFVVSSPDPNAASRAFRITPAPIIVGREPPAELLIADPMISRRHAQLSAVPGGIHVRDLGSSNGTYVNEQPVTDFIVTGTDTLRMGNTMLSVSPAGVSHGKFGPRAPWYRSKAALIATAVVLVLFGGGVAYALTRDSGSSSATTKAQSDVGGKREKESQGGGPDQPPAGSSAPAGFTPDLIAKLQKATVLITVYSEEGQPVSIGSGVLIRQTGLILTNAHVAAPDAQGLGLSEGEADESPAGKLQISMITSADKPAEPRFLAEPIASDGYVDVAVLQITKTVDGEVISPDSLSLPWVPLGSSRTLRPGDEIGVIGYPGIGGGQQGFIDYANGTVSGWVADNLNRIGPRAWLKTSARIAPGNSGGLAADSSGRLIGIPTQNISQNNPLHQQYVSEGRIRPIAAARPVIEAARTGTASTYESPYFVPSTGDEEVTLDGWASGPPEQDCSYQAVQRYPSGASSLTAVFKASGIARGEDVVVRWNYRPDPETKLVWIGESHSVWKPQWGRCFLATLPGDTDATHPSPPQFPDFAATAPDGEYFAFFRYGPNLQGPPAVPIAVGDASSANSEP
jgi:putative serine protease PepD